MTGPVPVISIKEALPCQPKRDARDKPAHDKLRDRGPINGKAVNPDQTSEPRMQMRIPMGRILLTSLISLVIAPSAAQAAPLNGAALHWPWALPFIGILTTIAIAPLLAPKFWRRHYGKLAFIWGALAVVPLAGLY